jgi:hypothetical protein
MRIRREATSFRNTSLRYFCVPLQRERSICHHHDRREGIRRDRAVAGGVGRHGPLTRGRP